MHHRLKKSNEMERSKSDRRFRRENSGEGSASGADQVHPIIAAQVELRA
jgi:hypothetical protein